MSISKVEPAVFTGFDRIVFKGCIRQLAYADGAARFLAGRGVLNKDYKAWMAGQSSALVAAVTDPTLASLGGITNKALQKRLAGTEWAKGMTGRRLSARIGRQLRPLRDHGVISKVPDQRKYVLSEKGRRLTALIPAILSASTEQLTDHAA